MKITIAQINPIIGDIEGNFIKIKDAILKALSDKSDIVVFSELSLLGYPPFDLLKNNIIKNKIEEGVKRILQENFPINILLGAPYFEDNRIYNSIYWIKENKIIKRIDKFYFSNDPIGQGNYFSYGTPDFLEIDNKKIGLFIGDDFIFSSDHSNYKDYLKTSDLILIISSSFYYFGKRQEKIEKISQLAKGIEKEVIYVNQVGGNGELIFEGGSLAISKKGELLFEGEIFKEDIKTIDLKNLYPTSSKGEDISFLYDGLVLGVRDFIKKSGFQKAVIGLSGGIDSALVACIAREALGEENVLGVSLPSIYTSRESIEDAEKLSKNLGIEFRIIPISDIFYSYLKELNPSGNPIMDVAEENLQSRIRGNLLMFISNREEYILLATGNRSEALTGYCTLYGDTAGALEVIGDIYKTTVYELANYVNKNNEIIPQNILAKAPSAELRPGQKDEDSLPPYSILDPILKAYVDENKSLEEIVQMGYKREIVKTVIEKVERSEYKRRQIPPVLRIRSKNPLKERFFPLVYKII
ncbi:MAG: NAD+ synthase [Dictyoglomus turgidum]